MESEIIIPKGYENVIIAGGKYGKLKFVGEELEILATPREVYSSEDAATMRGYPLRCELKTGLMETKTRGEHGELFLCHVAGDVRVDNGALKRILRETYGNDIKGFERADNETLAKLHCVYGTLNPFSEFLAKLPQFVSNDLVGHDPNLIGTNAGTLTTFVKFDRNLLLKMGERAPLITGNFSKTVETADI